MDETAPGSWHANPSASAHTPAGRIGPYPILAELGRGGMGAVYRCRHPQLNREVAVKVLLAGEHAGQRQLERFWREAQAAASLRHPHITAVHDVGQDAGKPYIVMDLVEGRSLQERIDEQPLEPREAARLARDLARALGYAHAQGVLHRDVKPSNVLLTPEGEPLLTDFGLAKRVDAAEEGGITVTGQFLGTPGYMPPEQARGKVDEIDRRADVYALGATLYAMLAGDHPFADQTGIAILAATLEGTPPSLRRERPELPRDLETICLHCLEKDPDDRYPSALDLADDLERFLQDEPITAQPATALDRLRKWTRRNRALALVSGAALGALTLGAVGFGVWTVRARAAAAVAAAEARDAAAAEQRQRLAAEAREEVAAHAQTTEGAGQLGAALARLQAAQRWRALAPDDPAAGRALLEAALALGDEALETEQWGLARQAFAQARGLGSDQVVDARIARVAEERAADDRRRRAEIETLLVRAENGTLATRPGAVDDALFAIVRLAGPETVAQLAARLDEVSARLRAEERAAYRAALGAGSTPTLAQVEAALKERRAVGVLGLSPAARAALRAADAQLERRLRGLHLRETARGMIAAGQRSILGVGPLLLAELICRSLGRIRRREAVPALGRYLAAEADPLRAAHAGLALARLGGVEAQQHLVRAFTRFGQLSLFTRRIQPTFRLLPDAPPPVRADDPRSYAARALYHQLREAFPRALADADVVVRLRPRDPQALADRAVILGNLERYADAVEDLNRALKLRPRHVDTLLRRGELLMLRGREHWPQAEADAAAAIRLDPGESGGWGLRAQLRERAGDIDGAEQDFDRAVACDPRNARSLVNRGGLRSRRGEDARAFNDLSRAIALNPSMARAWANRAIVRKRLGDPAGAEDDYDQALRLAPRLANCWVNRGHLRTARGDLSGAIRDYQQALQLQPKSQLAQRALKLAEAQQQGIAASRGPQDALKWLKIGRQQLKRGAEDRAFAAFCIAVRVNPGLAAAWAARGRMHAKAGEHHLALLDYERALDLEPMNPAAWVNRGSSRYELGQLTEARLDFDQAIRLAPRQPIAFYNRGTLRYQQGDLRGADQDLTRTLELRPAYAPARLWRAVVRRWLGEREAARQDLDAILQRDPRHDGALAHRAMLRLTSGDAEGAWADAHAALKLNKRASPAWLARGVLCARKQQRRAALVALQNAIRLGVKGLDAQLARSTLAELGAR